MPFIRRSSRLREGRGVGIVDSEALVDGVSVLLTMLEAIVGCEMLTILWIQGEVSLEK